MTEFYNDEGMEVCGRPASTISTTPAPSTACGSRPAWRTAWNISATKVPPTAGRRGPPRRLHRRQVGDRPSGCEMLAHSLQLDGLPRCCGPLAASPRAMSRGLILKGCRSSC